MATNGPSDETLDELIGPVCQIADLEPTPGWPREFVELVAAARRVKALYGFEIDNLPVPLTTP